MSGQNVVVDEVDSNILIVDGKRVHKDAWELIKAEPGYLSIGSTPYLINVNRQSEMHYSIYEQWMKNRSALSEREEDNATNDCMYGAGADTSVINISCNNGNITLAPPAQSHAQAPSQRETRPNFAKMHADWIKNYEPQANSSEEVAGSTQPNAQISTQRRYVTGGNIHFDSQTGKSTTTPFSTNIFN